MQRSISIHYRRLPDRDRVFHQTLVAEREDYCVTLLDSADLEKPVLVDGRTVLEPGSPVVWFTYPGRWYDIGRFHLADGTFTGFYANILTPVRMDGDSWWTNDLCLDVWIGQDGAVQLLDEDEFHTAVQQEWMDERTAARACETAATLAASAAAGAWPPPHVHEWTLERAMSMLSSAASAEPASR